MHQQHCCWGTCQITERWDNFNDMCYRLDISQDLWMRQVHYCCGTCQIAEEYDSFKDIFCCFQISQSHNETSFRLVNRGPAWVDVLSYSRKRTSTCVAILLWDVPFLNVATSFDLLMTFMRKLNLLTWQGHKGNKWENCAEFKLWHVMWKRVSYVSHSFLKMSAVAFSANRFMSLIM